MNSFGFILYSAFLLVALALPAAATFHEGVNPGENYITFPHHLPGQIELCTASNGYVDGYAPYAAYIMVGENCDRFYSNQTFAYRHVHAGNSSGAPYEYRPQNLGITNRDTFCIGIRTTSATTPTCVIFTVDYAPWYAVGGLILGGLICVPLGALLVWGLVRLLKRCCVNRRHAAPSAPSASCSRGCRSCWSNVWKWIPRLHFEWPTISRLDSSTSPLLDPSAPQDIDEI